MGLAFPSASALDTTWLRVVIFFIIKSGVRNGERSFPCHIFFASRFFPESVVFQKGGVPAAPSGTATLLRLSPSYRYYPRTLLAVAYFRYSRLPWLDGRCVQGPGTYSPRRG